METSTITSIVAVAISFLALPMSYFVATKQVRIGFDEHERRAKERSKHLVAKNLEDLTSIFFGAAEATLRTDRASIMGNPSLLEPQISAIEQNVASTGILSQLGKSIDKYFDSFISSTNHSEITGKLIVIRGLCEMSSTMTSKNCAWDILNISQGGTLSAAIRASK